MILTNEEVEKVADLASLYLSEEEKQKYKDTLGDIITMVEQLGEVDTTNVDSDDDNALFNVFREDKAIKTMEVEKLLKNAENYKDGQFYVPKVVE